MKDYKYILITPAKNEGEYLEKTIESVVDQTLQPYKWLIISDASTDNTDEIIKKYAQKYSFISYIRNEKTDSRNFASKVYVINLAFDFISKNNLEYDFIGILDADTVFDNNYYELILQEFEKDDMLGLAGGYFYENYKGKEIKVILDKNSVRGAVQFFRKECLKDIGGFVPLEDGGEDIITEVTARMKGWKVRSFDHLRVTNLRLSGTGRWNIYETKFREGILAHSIGYHPLFYFVKCIYRLKERPFILAGSLHLAGYIWAVIKKNKVKVNKEFITFFRNEQLQRLKKIIALR